MPGEGEEPSFLSELFHSPKAVVIVSGGLDSCGVAAYWKRQNRELHLLTFDYGQRASQELQRAKEIGLRMGVRDHQFVDISFLKKLYGSSNVLTDESQEMPSTFKSSIIVPLRNAIFLTIGAAYAFSMGAGLLAYGAHLTDQPYPDCRPEFARELATALNLGDLDAIQANVHPKIEIWSPATQGLTKEEMLKISFQLLGDSVYRTWSCYLNDTLHCGKCESCNNRKKAFKLAGIPDMTEYSS
jgi:7-cyano-7-deazaguanine synthase